MSRFASFLLALPLALALLAGVEATSQADISAYLNAHNTVRAQHGATALKWNNTLDVEAGSADTYYQPPPTRPHAIGPIANRLAAFTCTLQLPGCESFELVVLISRWDGAPVRTIAPRDGEYPATPSSA